MTLNEALVASTIDSAFVGKEKEAGSLEVGKSADFIILKNDSWKRTIYQMGESKDLIQAVLKGGYLVKGSFLVAKKCLNEWRKNRILRSNHLKS